MGKDIIQLLPDSVANQIAAGEVIQRPASAVKELLENAIDSGAKSVTVIIKDAGKTLLQVIDDGSGMSETDARMCFERHATSKIKEAKDLFNVRTMGFRGEAMASIAAIAQVELKSKKTGDELGTEIIIEGSEVKSQEVCNCANGTSTSVKYLFYNVPARRNFLKSDPVEMRHIIDEFQRIAIANPSVKFSIFNNENELFHLKEGSLRQRIVGIFGKNYNQRLVPVDEKASLVTVNGFIGKPEYSKKTRGEQFFFVNNRFIKNGYLHHAVQNAFQELIPKDCHPTYFIFLEMDTKSIDINIHPTKTEIKFDNDRAVYAILLAAVKQSLGKYNIAPVLDFNQETSFDVPPLAAGKNVEMPSINVDPTYNPFSTETLSPRDRSNKENWEKLFQSSPGLDRGLTEFESAVPEEKQASPAGKSILKSEALEMGSYPSELKEKSPFQLQRTYIISHIKSGLIIVHQQYASERISYEKYLYVLENNKGSSQKQLFKQTIEFSASDFLIYKEIEEEIQGLGFDIREFGKNAVVVEGLPADTSLENAESLIQNILEQYKNNVGDIKLEKRDNLARSLARNTCIKRGQGLQQEEMTTLIDELFACSMPYYSPYGNPTVTTLTMDDLDKRFTK